MGDAMFVAENGVVTVHPDSQLAGVGAVFSIALAIADSEIAKVIIARGIRFS